MHVQPLSLDKFGDDLHPFPAFTASVCNLRPTSRGRITLRDADPASAPIIDPNYLSTEDDLQVASDSLRAVRRIATQPALARYRPREVKPGPEARDEASLRQAAAALGTTIFHPVGTARMGREDDAGAVCDARLKVHGISHLRIADASVMPAITSGNTAAPTMMIAEKCASMMREEARG
jgi:choline dehydrogenase